MRNRQLILTGFQHLLRLEIFKGGLWKLERSLDATMSQNRALIYEGAFNTTSKRFPSRRIYLRLVGPDEEIRESKLDGDLAITFQLMLNYDQPDHERRHLPGQLRYPQDKTIAFELNLSHNNGKENSGDLNQLNPLIAPWKITPALLLSLYAYLEEKRASSVIPKTDDEFIKSNFQPILLEHALNELFNPELGVAFNAAQARIVEEAVRRELEKHYSQYKTFINGGSQWRQNLRGYRKGLEGLPTPFERQGQQVYDKSHQEMAKLFAKITTSSWR